jgi:glycerol-3-phosphate dehydrogenase (NAD(P)+)
MNPAKADLVPVRSYQKAGVIGAGSWGTALSILLHQNGLPVSLWAHQPQTLEDIARNRENRVYLPGIPFPETIALVQDLARLRDCDLLLVVTPSKAIRETARRINASNLAESALLLSCTKGMEIGTGLRMSEVLQQELPTHRVSVLSGPSHAEEVARRTPTAVVLASAMESEAKSLQNLFSNRFFRTYTNTDVTGVELGGALKNIYALAAGVADGLRLGDNTKAALITRALAEMVRIGAASGGHQSTFYGLSGVGDLMVTCFSKHSRNRLVGERLGKGETLSEITASMQMVAEGVPTTFSVAELAQQKGLDAPIVRCVKAILLGELSPTDALQSLLARDPRGE